MAGLLHGAELLKCKTDQTYLYGLVCFVINSERRKILKKWNLSVKMKIRKGEICRYTGALGLEVLDRRYVFAPEAAMKQAMDWYKERI